MCAEIAQFSSFLMTGEEKEKDKELGIIITSESQTAVQQEREETQTETETSEADHPTKITSQDDDAAIKSEEQNDVDEPTVSVSEDDDGFKTPTSSHHRIPPITQCPPAPRKPRPPPPKLLKRKAPGSSRGIQLDESIFSPTAKDEDDAPPQKIKKARTDDQDRS